MYTLKKVNNRELDRLETWHSREIGMTRDLWRTGSSGMMGYLTLCVGSSVQSISYYGVNEGSLRSCEIP